MWDVIASEHGVGMTYSPKGGAASSITGTFTLSEIGPQLSDDGRNLIEDGMVIVSRSDVASPREGDTVTVSGITYNVKSAANDGGNCVRLMVSRIISGEKSARNARIERY